MTIAAINEQTRTTAAQYGLNVECAGDGSFYAKIAVISDYPGPTEVQRGMPMVGGAGQFLWKALRKYEISRTDCYTTNVAKRSVVDDGTGSKYALGKHELELWRNILIRELESLPALEVIFIAGSYALQALVGVTGITEWRGSVVNVKIGERMRKAVIANNPASILRNPANEVIFAMDCRKLATVLAGKWKDYHIVHHTSPTFAQANEWIDMLDGKRDLHPISFDIETLNGETACIGLTNNTNEGMCISFRDMYNQCYSLREEYHLRRRITKLLQTSRTVAQNGNFDSYFLWCRDKINPGAIWFDTLLAHHTLYPTLPHNLGFLTAQYTNHPFYKDDGKLWKLGGHTSDIDDFWRYNVKDVCITLKCQQALLAELEAQKQDGFFFNHVMRLQPHLVRMTVGGIKTDLAVKEQLRTEIGTEIESLLKDFYEKVFIATGEEQYYPNPNSPKQIAELLYQKMRIVTRTRTTSVDALDAILSNHRTTDGARDVIMALKKYRKEHKFFSTYVENEIDSDGRMRCEYKQFGVASAPGRLSSSKTMWGSGGNLQNQPERAYEMYAADEGYTFVYFDLAQAEARVVAWEVPIPKWIEQFERARIDGLYDAHRALASEMFKVPYDEVPTFDRYNTSDGHPPPEGGKDGDVTIRFTAKRCRHGLNYRMQAARLAETTGLRMQTAIRAYELYHRTTPELVPWWKALEHEARTTKMLFNAMGRRLRIIGRITDESLESIVAFKPQSLIGDKVCQVIYMSHDDPDWPAGARICLNIHDALVALTPIGQEAVTIRVMKRHAEDPLQIKGKDLIIPADFAVAAPDEQGVRRWSTLKKLKKAQVEEMITCL